MRLGDVSMQEPGLKSNDRVAKPLQTKMGEGGGHDRGRPSFGIESIRITDFYTHTAQHTLPLLQIKARARAQQ